MQEGQRYQMVNIFVDVFNRFDEERKCQGRGHGGYIGIYTPKSAYLTNFNVVTGCCFFSLTQDKFDIVPVCALARISFTYLHTTIYTPPPK